MTKNKSFTNSNPSTLTLLIAACFCAALSGCLFDPQKPAADASDQALPDGSTDSFDSPPADITDTAGDLPMGDFYVVSTSPQAGAQNIDLGSSIRIEFSLPVDPLSLTDASVKFLDETGAKIPVSLMPEGASLSVKPLAALTLLTRFTLEISTEAKSTSGSNLQAAYATTLRTRDGVWSAPHALDSDLGEDVRQPAVAADEFGNVIVVWSVMTPAFVPSRGRIFAAYRAPGQPWSAPVALNGSADLSAYPSVAMREGKAWAVWRTFKDATLQVVASEFNGQQWLAPTPVVTLANHEVRDVHIVAIGGGRALTVWDQKERNADDREIKASLRTGGAWQAPTLLNSVQTPINPRVAAVGGGAAVAWITYDGDNKLDITLRAFDGMTWKPNTPLNIGIMWPDSVRELRLAPDNLGGVAAIWAHSTLNPEGSSLKSVPTKDGTAMPSTELRAFETTNKVRELATASSDAGAAMAMWCQESTCWFASNATGTWSTSPLGESATWGNPTVERDSRNNGIVTWLRKVDEKSTIYFKRLIGGQLATGDSEAFPRQQDNAWNQTLALGRKGNAAVSWNENSSLPGGSVTSGKLWVRVFE